MDNVKVFITKLPDDAPVKTMIFIEHHILRAADLVTRYSFCSIVIYTEGIVLGISYNLISNQVLAALILLMFFHIDTSLHY